MHKTILISLFALCTFLSGCGKKTEAQPVSSINAKAAEVTDPAAQNKKLPSSEVLAAASEAALQGDTTAIATALKNGVPVDQIDENSNSLLMLASFDGHLETMQLLLDSGADVNLRNTMNRTALMFASSGPNPAAVKLLLTNHAELNAIDRDEHFTALMFAAAEGLSPIVDILLEAGADPALMDKDDDTASSFARKRGFTALADRLQAITDAK